MKYYEFAIGNVTNRGLLLTMSTYGDWVKKAVKEGKELYRSMYYFGEKLAAHLENRKSVKGYIYDYYIDNLILDIDRNGDDSEKVYKRARAFLERLFDDYGLDEGAVKLYFSGTGYHILIPDIFGFRGSVHLPATVKATLESCFPEADMKPYMNTGLIRMANTINKKSGLYKIPLTFEEWESGWEKIEELAKESRIGFDIGKMEKPKKMFPELIVVKETKKNSIAISNPTADVTCVQKMYNKGPEKGKRHDRMMRMVSAYRRKNVPKEMVIDSMKAYMCKDGSQLSAKEEYAVEKHVNDVYDKAYSYSCNDKVMMEFCDPRCKYFQNKDYIAHVYSPSDMELQLHKMAVDIIDGRKKINFRDIFHLNIDHIVYPGMVVNIIGDTGMNKTSILQNIVVKLKKMNVLYISTEFAVPLLHRRFIQINRDMSKNDVLRYYYDEHFRNDNLLEGLEHLSYMRVTPNIHELRKVITRANPDVVAIDVINDVPVDGKLEGVARDEKLAKFIKDTTDELGLITFTVQHISKSASQFEDKNGQMMAKRMTVHSGKGGSGLEQKADVVLGINGERKHNKRDIELLKGRDDPWFRKELRVDMETFKMHADLK